MTGLVDPQESKMSGTLDLTDALSAIGHLEILELNLIESSLSRPLQSLGPSVVSKPVANEISITGIDKNGDFLEKIRNKSVVRLHPVTGEQEVPVDIEVAGIVAIDFGTDGIDNTLFIQEFGNPAEVGVAEVGAILARSTDIVDVGAGALVRSHHDVVAVDGSWNAGPDALGFVAAGDHASATWVGVLHTLALRLVKNGWVATLSAGHGFVVFVLGEAIGETVSDEDGLQVDVAILVGEDLVGEDGDVVTGVGFTRNVEVLLGVFGELLEEQGEEGINILAGGDGVGNLGSGVGVADVDGLVEEDDGSIVVP